MHSCPSCSAPLDDEGICTSCGALSRGFFGGLDLGAPQVAEAVANGLDFYLLLGVASSDDTRAIARRYRQLRVLFPDDSSGLAPTPARKLALLERAGRVLTDPELRQTYDRLRAGSADGGAVMRAVLRCAGCSAPLAPDATRCPFCGTARPPEPQAPAAPPADADPLPAEPVDYYAMLGLTAAHLLAHAPSERPGLVEGGWGGIMNGDWKDLSGGAPFMPPAGPPTPADVDAAALARQRQILLSPGYAPAEREARADEFEIARRILREEGRRLRYDMLLLGFRQGLLDGGRLDALRHLQDLARADIAEERGDEVSAAQAAALLRQGIGYLDAKLPRDALAPLRRAVQALPDSAEAHAAYVRALLEADDPLNLGAHALRQALASLDALERLGASGQGDSARAALCCGLLARDEGDPAVAERELRQAVELERDLPAAWRGLAALAIQRGAIDAAIEHCRRALAIDARDERALTLLAGACLRARRHAEAREAAAQIAAARGASWSADDVLRELVG